MMDKGALLSSHSSTASHVLNLSMVSRSSSSRELRDPLTVNSQVVLKNWLLPSRISSLKHTNRHGGTTYSSPVSMTKNLFIPSQFAAQFYKDDIAMESEVLSATTKGGGR